MFCKASIYQSANRSTRNLFDDVRCNQELDQGAEKGELFHSHRSRYFIGIVYGIVLMCRSIQTLFDRYPKLFLVGVDNVGSKQMQEIRQAMRGRGEGVGE